MSVIRKLITQIENLNVEQLCEALEYNGYGDCVDRVRSKSVDGQAFLKLTEVQVSMWRLTPPQMRRLWSFIEHVRQNPTNFVLVPQKTSKVPTPPISNFNNVLNNFQSHSLGRPQLKQKPKYLEKSKIENFASTSENRKFSSLSKEDSKLVKGKLEDLFKADLNQNNTFLHNIKPSFPPKSPVNNYVEENNNLDDDDDDYNNGYLPPISIEQPLNLRTPPVENKNTFLNKTRKFYENHDIETEPRPPAGQNYRTLPKRPLPSIPREMPTKFEPPKFQNKAERQNLIPQRPPPKTASIFKRPMLPMANERHKIEEPEEELEEYTSVIEEEPLPSKRPLPPIPIEDEDLPEYGTISEEEEEEGPCPISAKHPFKPIDPHQNFLSQLKSVTNSNYKPVMVEEEQEYEPIPDVIEKKEKILKPSINLKSRPLPPPPIISSYSSQWAKEERSRPVVPMSSNRSNQRAKEKVDRLSDSDEDSVLSELRKMSKSDSLNSLVKSPARTIEKSRSPVNLPKPPALPPNLLQFDRLNLTSNNTSIMPKDDFDKETYYRETDRKGARMILKNLEVGTFLVRPSRDEDYICTISIAHSKKMFNVGVQRDSTTGIITLGSIMDVEQPDFKRLQDLINYYCVHPLCLAGQLIVLKNILPFELR